MIGVVLLGLDAPGPRDSWTEGTPHFSACYEGALSGIGGLEANPRTQPTPRAAINMPDRSHDDGARISNGWQSCAPTI
jgi:hypothetical protein